MLPSLSLEEQTRYDELENQESVKAEQVEDDTLVLDYEQTDSDDVDAPLTPNSKNVNSILQMRYMCLEIYMAGRLD